MKLRIKEPEMERPYQLPFTKTGLVGRAVSGALLVLCPVALTAFNFIMASYMSQVLCVGAVVLGCLVYAVTIAVNKALFGSKMVENDSIEKEDRRMDLSIQEERVSLLHNSQ